jgi:beta-glucosidase
VALTESKRFDSTRFDTYQEDSVVHPPRSVRRRQTRRTAALAAAVVVAATGALVAPRAATGAVVTAADLPFRDPRLPIEQRVADLMSRLTLDERIGLLHQYQQPVPRLGIGIFKAGTEALHGVAWSNDHRDNGNVVTATATQFPQALGLASTWDRGLVEQVGSAVGDEARGLHAKDPEVWGLNLWAPVVNLLRDPRWGRNEEGYSEDALLTGAVATAYGSGIQGRDTTYLKAAPTLKHLIGYNNEAQRDTSSSNLPPRVLNEYELKAFTAPLAAGAATGMMASYNLVNGRPSTVDPLIGQLRSVSKTPLYNVSDAFAPGNLVGSQHYFDTQPEADAAMFRAGIDGYVADNADPTAMTTAVKEALAKGFMTEADVDAAASHALTLRFRLGEFDPDGGPYGALGASEVNAPEHQQLARTTAAEAMVLLKNSRNALPLDAARDQKVAVIGQLADTVYSDWYGGNAPYTVTPAAGITKRLGSSGSVSTVEGVDRIALRDKATGKYVTSRGTTGSDTVAAAGDTAGPAAQFDVFDWGEDVVTLRNVSTGNVVGNTGSALVTKDKQPNGWFVQQQFAIENQPDGSVVLRYAGYETRESWYGGGTYVRVGPDGVLRVDARSASEASRFTRETLSSGTAQAAAAAARSDAAVLVVGSMPFINGRENRDRTSMELPAAQRRLVEAVLAANPHTVLVLETSYPETIDWAQQTVPAIVWTTHAGQETGNALADVLFGDVNPSGHLTQTWYREGTTLPSIHDYDIIKSRRTYQYYEGTPLYPFGHGLSYTDFAYGRATATPASVAPDGTVTVRVTVRNTGTRAGADVVQLYDHQRTSRTPQPQRRLLGFAKVTLAPGESRQVAIKVKAADLAVWDVTRGRWVVERSVHDLLVGRSSADIRARTSIDVRGEVVPARDLGVATRAMNFDDYSGITLVDESKAAGTSITAPEAGGWAVYRDARLGSGPLTFTAQAALDGPADATVELRVGSPTGPVVGRATVAPTGSVYTYRPVTASVTGSVTASAGTEDLYLVLDKGVRISSFTLR